MRLPGRLAASTLGDLLGALHRHRTTGLLELAEVPGSTPGTVVGRRHRIHLYCGLVSGVETSLPCHPLGELLRSKGLLPPEALSELMRLITSGDRRLAGEILVGEGLLQKPIVDLGLRSQLREKLDTLFGIADADIRFHTARPLSDAARRIGLLSSNEFLHGRPRARDRLRPAGSGGGRPFDQPERRVSPNRPWAGRTQARADAPEEAGAASQGARFAATPEDDDGPRSEYASRRGASTSDPRARALRMLGLPGEADEATIRRAFRRLAIELHPDRHTRAPAATREQRSALFAEVSAAYHLLVA